MALQKPILLDPTTGEFRQMSSSEELQTNAVVSLPLVIDGNGNVISTGSKGVFTVGFAAQVVGWRILADVSGSIVVDVKAGAYSSFPTAASIAGSEKPTLSSAQKNEDTTITTWTALAATDFLEINVDSVSSVTRVQITLLLKRV